MLQNSKVFGVQPSIFTRNWAKKAYLFHCRLQHYVCANLDFPLYFIWKTSIGIVWNHRTICAWLWANVCQGM